MDNMKTEEDIFNILRYGKCRRCDAPGRELHTCPYSEEIHNDCSECNCCDNCCHAACVGHLTK